MNQPWPQRTKRLLGAALLTLAWAGVCVQAAHAKARDPDTFVYAIAGEVDSLDPAWRYDSISGAILYQIYETLITYQGSSTARFEPLLATVVPDRNNGGISEDGRRYTFPLRKGVRFHDGLPMTPEDVRYSILRFMLTDRIGGPSGLLLEPLLGVHSVMGPDKKPLPGIFAEADKAVAVENGALVLRLKKPSGAFLSILAGYCPIVSKRSVLAAKGWDGSEAAWQKHINPAKEDAALYDRCNGTGPFRLVRWDRKNRLILLARHEGYWRKPARLRYVVFKTVTDPSARKLMLLAGDADTAIIDRLFLPQFKGSKGVRIFDDLPLLNLTTIFIPNFKIDREDNPYVGSGKLDGEGIPPDFFSDIDVRKGLACAFDYAAFIRDGYAGKAKQPRGPIPPAISGHNPRQAFWTHDPAKAAEHFKKAWQGRVWDKGFRFTVMFPEGTQIRVLASHILKTRVEALNPRFRIDVQALPMSTYRRDFRAGKAPVVISGWDMDFADAHNAVYPFLHSQGVYAKRQGYSNPRADSLIDAAWTEQDSSKRKALYAELQAIAYRDLPQIPTVGSYGLQIIRTWVKGWSYNPLLPYGWLYPVYKD